jgi:hypothetical protein
MAIRSRMGKAQKELLKRKQDGWHLSLRFSFKMLLFYYANLPFE